ncbi:glucose/quinate/shikimate family membrane-bound PQQ-dependent dehydrogenase [Sphingomonas oligophenolica]|uniref:PQQ-binding-like beta-propeller repeat protein n=1 Tax=Sphingomonas oligophenolica TaxID=301154 RepID=A0ABU9Y645_9SPHN
MSSKVAIALCGLLMASFAVRAAVGAQPAQAVRADGQALFKARCAQCHEPAIERAPGLEQINKMTPQQIFGVLHGVMAPMAAGLSEAEKQAIANYLGARPSASAPPPISAEPTKAPPAPSATATSVMSSTGVNIPNLPTAPTSEWRAYKGNYASQNYAALDQINKDTVKGLHVAWRQSLSPQQVRQALGSSAEPSGNNQTTPLMIGGMVYYSSGVGGVVALDAVTGKVVWHVDSPVATAVPKPRATVSSADAPPRGDGAAPIEGSATRAIAYWTDGKGDDRIIAQIGNRYLTALNARTGKRYPDFGVNGQVDLRQGLEKGGEAFAWLTGPTVIVRGVVIIGTAIEDINDDRRVTVIDNPRGDVRGIDVRTGKQLWVWRSIPQAGEFGNDTWEEGSWKYTGGTNVWAPMSGDEELGLVYLPESSPSNDWYGGKRRGANLFSDSIVALDARTGKRAWHFQTVHHDIWDYDLPSAPVLADIVVDGRPIKALAQTSKQAYLYVLDRTTGKPVWPIIEHPAPAGDAPGEWYSPTQPMPLDSHGMPFAYDQQGVSASDLMDFTPELHEEAVKILDQYAYGPVYFPVVVDGKGKGVGKKGSLHMPTSSGGTNWPGAALDPETNILYVPSITATRSAKLGPPPAGSDTFLVRKDAARPDGPQGLPLFKPPYGRLVAIDLNKGELKWTVANGDGPRNHPALKGLNLPPLGEPGRVGPLVTKSLVFMGEGMTQSPPGAGGKKFRAFDKATGRVVWETTLDGETTGVPMTYAWKGKQYIVVPIGGPGHPGEFVALTIN